MPYDAEPRIIRASELRNEITGLVRPEPGKMYLVEKRGVPLFLIWPIEEAQSIIARQRHILVAIKARNKVRELGQIEQVPSPPPRVSMTKMRRGIVDFTQRISLDPTPGLITNYEVVVGIYVPMQSREQARKFIVAVNQMVM